ncbi:diacylglycerol kinase [Sphingobacterium faecium NBRC 15299]|jgi:diacylglycerol kinase|uniref:diacylglycerol kinase family protein n=1 Tax=Sphingobacterium faecium TaxID=34087 RepID=UPI000D34A710|nr:diacylglycerol kinase family protein [Sphingobacterium faecium]PTX10096.1 diacylglycerol kinase (ATP) [Sphingobacterium faecium]GEM65397.1 diacylglycerol kinase [Sphingobacterium faecium NBRC 15299]
MKNQKFSLQDRIKSFTYAFNGFKILLIDEHNARIHLVATVVTVIAGFYFDISKVEWMIVLLCIGAVFALEIINSAIENLADLVCQEKNEYVKKAKDLAAAAVLTAAFVSAIIALIIFIPKIMMLWF